MASASGNDALLQTRHPFIIPLLKAVFCNYRVASSIVRRRLLGHTVSDPDSGDLFTGLLPTSMTDYINTEGKRFVNEYTARDTLAIAAFDNGGLFCMIADINIAENARWLSNWETEVERGNTIMADTLAELADKMGFEGETKVNFLETIEKYNSYVDAGVDADFQKNALNMKVVDAPFFASLRKPALHHAMGGLTIDTTAHVLDRQRNVIPLPVRSRRDGCCITSDGVLRGFPGHFLDYRLLFSFSIKRTKESQRLIPCAFFTYLYLWWCTL